MGTAPSVDNIKAMLREGVSILTASRGDQPSVETAGGGLFTSLIVDALEGGAADLGSSDKTWFTNRVQLRQLEVFSPGQEPRSKVVRSGVPIRRKYLNSAKVSKKS